MTRLQIQQIDKLIDKLQVEFEHEMVPVQVESYSREKQCYSNVEEKVKRDGGRIHYGWSVHFTSGIIIEAERHAVWENDDEELICVTPHPSNHNEVIFISDDVPVDPDLQIDNVRMNITNNPLVDDWIYLCDTIGQIYYKFTDRKSDEEVIMAEPVSKVLSTIEQYRGLVMGLIELGRRERSNCYCEEGFYHKKKYLHCHSKIFRKEIPELIDSISKFEKR